MYGFEERGKRAASPSLESDSNSKMPNNHPITTTATTGSKKPKSDGK